MIQQHVCKHCGTTKTEIEYRIVWDGQGAVVLCYVCLEEFQ